MIIVNKVEFHAYAKSKEGGLAHTTPTPRWATSVHWSGDTGPEPWQRLTTNCGFTMPPDTYVWTSPSEGPVCSICKEVANGDIGPIFEGC